MKTKLPWAGVPFLCLTLVSAGRMEASSASWSVAYLDRALASASPGQRTARVGDMVVALTDLQAWRDQLAGGPAPQSAFSGTAATWPGGNVYYTFETTGSDAVPPAKQQVFVDCAQEWATFANLHFMPWTGQANYVLVSQESNVEGGFSAVGMIGGEQTLTIGPTSWNHGTVCHEIGHTLGLVHEHQRSDRDSYVLVFTNNILPGDLGDFVLLPDAQNKTAYDFLSVMHYARNSLSVSPSLDTLEPQPTYMEFVNIMGRQFDPVLSAGDRAGMAAVYGAGPPLSGTVTNTQDSGPGSLRAALYYAFDHPGTTITFDIATNDPGFSNNVFNLQPTDRWPSLVHATTLDGASEPVRANSNGPSVQLNGALAQPPDVYVSGLRLGGTNCAVNALVVNGFGEYGIDIDSTNATGNSITGCYLGIDPSGSVAVTNAYAGVAIGGGASGNTVGGETAAARNVISGSAYQGVALYGAGTTNNVIEGNYIGLNAAGTAALSNAWAGINLFGGAASNVIGGATPGARNVISGNGEQGVAISDPGTAGNVIEGNYIGLSPDGTGAISNGWDGVDVFNGAGGEVIGAPESPNLISGNGEQGVLIQDGSSNNVVQGNWIGLDASGTVALSNGWSGVQIASGSHSNQIGGALPGERNVIAGNGEQGVVLTDAGTVGNAIVGNYIGVDVSGMAAVSNGWAGVQFATGAQSNRIGGQMAGLGNVISGNGNQGLALTDSGTDGNVIQGNYIGVGADGATAIANGYAGVELYNGPQFTTIGGALPGEGNVISGNTDQGVIIDFGSANNRVQGNYIGLDATGSRIAPNGSTGVECYDNANSNTVGGPLGERNFIAGNHGAGAALDYGSSGNVIQGNSIGVTAAMTAAGNDAQGVVLFAGAQFNVIGGTAPGSANWIANNAYDGVDIFDTNTVDNSVRGNSIEGNLTGGFNLYNGGNLAAPPPAMVSAVVTTNLAATGTFSGQADSTYHLDFYASPAASPQGAVYLGARDVTTDSAGDAGFVFNFGATAPEGQVITCTATDASGNSSGLSPGVAATMTDSLGDGISDAWRRAHFGGAGTTTNAASCASCDPDHDGMSNYEEFLAGTDPNDAGSALRLALLGYSDGVPTISFATAAGVVYRVDERNDLAGGTWKLLLDQITGSGGAIQVSDSSAAGVANRFYRLVVLP